MIWESDVDIFECGAECVSGAVIIDDFLVECDLERSRRLIGKLKNGVVATDAEVIEFEDGRLFATVIHVYQRRWSQWSSKESVISKSYREIVKGLVNMRRCPSLPLFTACASSCVEMSELVRQLLEAGACVNEVDKNGWTAAHHAALALSRDTLKHLAHGGAKFADSVLEMIEKGIPIHNSKYRKHLQFLDQCDLSEKQVKDKAKACKTFVCKEMKKKKKVKNEGDEIWNDRVACWRYFNGLSECAECVGCGVKMRLHVLEGKDELSMDFERGHIISAADGGPKRIWNCLLYCRTCNSQTGSRNLLAWAYEEPQRLVKVVRMLESVHKERQCRGTLADFVRNNYMYPGSDLETVDVGFWQSLEAESTVLEQYIWRLEKKVDCSCPKKRQRTVC